MNSNQSKKVKEFFNDTADERGINRNKAGEVYNTLRTFNLILKNLKSNQSILDAGCGEGELLAFLEKNGFKKLYGIDFAPNMIKKAREKTKAKLYTKDLDKMHFQNNHFDAVIFIGVLRYLSDALKTLKKVRKLLKRGGKLIICSMNEKGNKFKKLFTKRSLKINWYNQPGNPNYKCTEEFILNLLEKADFKIKKSEKYCFVPSYCSEKLLKYIILLEKIFEKTPFIKEIARNLIIIAE